MHSRWVAGASSHAAVTAGISPWLTYKLNFAYNFLWTIVFKYYVWSRFFPCTCWLHPWLFLWFQNKWMLLSISVDNCRINCIHARILCNWNYMYVWVWVCVCVCLFLWGGCGVMGIVGQILMYWKVELCNIVGCSSFL
jgi:hypothetical protein